MQSQVVMKTRASRLFRHGLFAALLLGAAVPAFDAHALSALQDVPGAESQPSEPGDKDAPATDALPAPGLLLPDPLVGKQDSATQSDTPKPLNAGQPAPAVYDISTVPEPVRKMRQLIVEAAASGDIERLRPLLGDGLKGTQISVGDTAGDPVNTLKELAGDPEGIEILSTMLNLLSTGFVHVSVGTPDEAYVWPYFAAKPLPSLKPPEKVELMRIVTAGDYQDMLDFGSYSFYRIGISPDGKWKFFNSGE